MISPASFAAARRRGVPLLIAGPCQLEGADLTAEVARGIRAAAEGLPLIPWFKGSFDKANRTSLDAPRGPGLERALPWLQRVREDYALPVITDVHDATQPQRVADAVDAVQIPAFLCRQTDLLVAAGRIGKPVLWKKGQFIAPHQVASAVAKLRAGGATEVAVAERGSSFGHGDLVVDFRSMADIGRTCDLVVMDAGHAAQRAEASGERTGGRREDVWTLALAGAVAGAEGLFVEVHPDPPRSLSDAATQWPLDRLRPLLERFVACWFAARGLVAPVA